MRDRAALSETSLDVDAIVDVLEEAPVSRGILFGSYATGSERPSSDVDLAVSFAESLSSVERTRARLELIERLSVRLRRDDIDVIPLSEVPPSLRAEIQDEGVVLYGSTTDLSGSSPDDGDTIDEFDAILDSLETVV